MKKLTIPALSLALLLMLGACGADQGTQGDTTTETQQQIEQAAEAEAVTLTDAAGNTLTFAEIPQRVAALSGSFGEIWINAGGTLVATTKDAVTERDLDLAEDVQIVGSIKEPDLEAVLAAEPDFVILSADTGSHIELAATLQQAGIPCGLFKVEYFEDYLNLLEDFCAITGRDDLYEKNGLEVQASIEETLSKAPDLEGKTVLLLRAFSSGFKAKDSENMTGTMLADFGLENILDKYDSLLEEISIEEIITADPDYIFVTTMGSDVQAAIDNLDASLTSNPAWSGLTAVQNGEYFILPQELFHYKPNARWSESYAHLLDLLAE